MVQDEEGFYYPEMDEEKCISCGKCRQVCPAIKHGKNKDEVLKAYACYNKDDKVREKSTSGGMFSAIAERFIEERKGIVCGVQYDCSFQAVYGMADKKDAIAVFRGSKYVQCRTGNIYGKIRKLLKEGRNVLFAGLPCQVEGLLCFLGKEFHNLYTVDMVCFGVPSPLIWKLYLQEFHAVDEIDEIVFKDKAEGWKNWKVKFSESGRVSYYERNKNLYMNSYLQRVNIRPSCFQCRFKGLDRKSDFTIADCWGIGEENERLNDDRGLSALLVHTWKGLEFFEGLQDETAYEEYNPDELMKGNWATYHSPLENEKRNSFFEEMKNSSFESVFREYFGNER